MSQAAKTTFEGISSNYVAADMAGRAKDNDGELKHLLYALQDCCVLLNLYRDGGWGIEKELALSYAKSAANTAIRIEALVEESTNV